MGIRKLEILAPAKSNAMGARLPALDLLRGIAVVAMVFFHLSFDLVHFAKTPLLAPPSWYWWAVPSVIGGIFLFLLGYSAQLRHVREGKSAVPYFRRRGLRIAALALFLSVVTFIFTPATPIYFGILHCVAVALLLLPLFLGKRARVLGLTSLILVAIGVLLARERFSFPYLLWLGFLPSKNAGWDYYPILPWFGVVLFGAGLARLSRFRSSSLPRELPSNSGAKILLWLGRNSLAVYILHQPLLLALLWFLGAISF